MKTQLLTFILCFSGYAHAMEISKGSNIDDVSAAMKADGYKTGGGFVIGKHKKFDSQFWSVDKGTLIVVFSKVTKKVLILSYHLADERKHAVRKEFKFNVISFDSRTGLLTLNTKRPAEQDVAPDS